MKAHYLITALLCTALASCGPKALPISITPSPTAQFDCPDPLAVIQDFYASNDAAQFEASLEFLTDDVTLDCWAQGAGGNRMAAKHWEGKQEVLTSLDRSGLHFTSEEPDAPIYSMVEVELSNNVVTFRLEPDRHRPDGKPYHSYRVNIGFDGCKITTLTVIELIYWL